MPGTAVREPFMPSAQVLLSKNPKRCLLCACCRQAPADLEELMARCALDTCDHL